jgi:hypothetical protein
LKNEDAPPEKMNANIKGSIMSLLADLVMRGCSYEFALEAKKYEHLFDGDLEEFIEKVQAMERVEACHQSDGCEGYGAYEQGRGVKIAERDYDGDALTWYGHDHWDDC